MDRSRPVLVGVDGSAAGIRAALWAVDEAIARDSPLRLVHAVAATSAKKIHAGTEAGHHVLHAAWEAVSACGKPVKLESEMLQGDPLSALVAASRRCALICVGHKGRKNSTRQHRGMIAAGLMRQTYAPVVVVRRRPAQTATEFRPWVITLLDDLPGASALLQTAMDESRLRSAPVLAFTSWTTSWTTAEPACDSGVRAELNRLLGESRDDPSRRRVCALPAPDDLSHLVEHSAAIGQLLVINAARGDVVDELTSARGIATLHGSRCSVMVIPHRG